MVAPALTAGQEAVRAGAFSSAQTRWRAQAQSAPMVARVNRARVEVVVEAASHYIFPKTDSPEKPWPAGAKAIGGVVLDPSIPSRIQVPLADCYSTTEATPA